MYDRKREESDKVKRIKKYEQDLAVMDNGGGEVATAFINQYGYGFLINKILEEHTLEQLSGVICDRLEQAVVKNYFNRLCSVACCGCSEDKKCDNYKFFTKLIN